MESENGINQLKSGAWISDASNIPDYVVGSETIRFSDMAMEWMIDGFAKVYPVKFTATAFEYELPNRGIVVVSYFIEGERLLLQPQHGFHTWFVQKKGGR